MLCILASILQILPLRVGDLFALQEFISYHFPIQRVWIMLHFLLELLDVPREYCLCRSEILDSTFLCVRTLRLVSLHFLGSEMSLTLSFFCRSDKLVLGLHLLLSPVSTAVKPAEHEVAHRLSLIPIPGAVSRCFPQNRMSTL